MINALLISAMILVESGGYAGAVGDGGRALGVLQIHAGVIVDVNCRFGTAFLHEDALDPVKAKEICRLYLKAYAPARASPKTLARIWNGGPTGHKKASTLEYWKKVETKYIELRRIHGS